MNWLAIAIILVSSFAVSWLGVELFRRWTVRRQLFDIPNERSSHSTPTPRGGGAVIVAVCLAGYALVTQLFDQPFSWGYFSGALLIAVVSWLDDLYSLPFWSRLIIHVLAALLVVRELGVFTTLRVPFASTGLELGMVLGGVVTVGWIVWLVNAYNFMDGIDGIAALQAVVAAAAWALLIAVMLPVETAVFPAVVLFSSLGFLIHNWQPAKIFMGDVGSAFLGFTLAAMPLVAGQKLAGSPREALPVVAVLFVWYFVFDTFITLVKRAVRRQRVWQPHREHFYQQLIISGRTHAWTTSVYGVLSAVLSVLVVLAVVFSGIWGFSAIFFLLVSSGWLLYSSRQKNVDVNA